MEEGKARAENTAKKAEPATKVVHRNEIERAGEACNRTQSTHEHKHPSSILRVRTVRTKAVRRWHRAAAQGSAYLGSQSAKEEREALL